MTPLPSRWVWLLLASASAPVAVHSLSSHSPRDLYSHPQFKVVVSEQVALNDTIPNLLSQAKAVSVSVTFESALVTMSWPNRRTKWGGRGGRGDGTVERWSDQGDVANVHVLRTGSGQAFLCTVPSVSEDEVEHSVKESTKDAVARQEERERGLENGLALLEPLRTQCLYSKKNWFTYSFCYGKHIRQFHELRVAGSVEPVEDVNNWSYTLGRYPAPQPAIEKVSPPRHVGGGTGNHNGRAHPATWAPGTISSVSTRAPGTLGGGPEMGLGDDEGGLYLTQIWDDGTICDKTGLPREVEVQFHCNTQTIDRIALIRETAICRYVMIIHTPRLCSEPVFLERQRTSFSSERGPSAIECRAVVRHLRESVDAPKVPTGPPIVRDDQEEVLAGHRLPKNTYPTVPATVPQPRKQQNQAPPQRIAPEEIVNDLDAPKDTTGGEEWGQSIDVELVYDPITGEVLEAAIVAPAEGEVGSISPPPHSTADDAQLNVVGQEATSLEEMKEQLLAQLDAKAGETKEEEVDDHKLGRVENMQELAKALNALLLPGDGAGGEGPGPVVAAGAAGDGGGGVGQGGAGAGAGAGGRIIKPFVIPVDAPGGLAGAVKAALEQITAQPGAGVGGVGGREGPPAGPIGYDGDEDVGKKGLEEVKVSKEYERLTEAFGRKWEDAEGEDGEEEGQERRRDEL
ncbi:BZ3500_MvSof-1268-A1-R1_Chr6-2g08521 [Microbotryum saponariae]|uniref:Protein OS-9 homolog n=1 Tax=Microbotryum saponariae TaxID=289078 RepID=A0A2X0MMY1_9BASI|nr:BZ3500_MvSof-1268-A1-R1_Chr6-2g08521 [Microbotryum saponariae]SDA07798.1 BZ3501_MvSof-1269-A2-R1_Chr6-1g08235 [Microbotryum saponariae]